MNLPKNEIGKRIRELREEIGISQTELAQYINVHNSLISRYENGKSEPTKETLKDILNCLLVFGVESEKLDEIWRIAGYTYSSELNEPAADPLVGLLQEELKKLPIKERSYLSEDVRRVIEINRAMFTQSHTKETLLAVRGLIEQRFQKWYLRTDKLLGKSHFDAGEYSQAIRQLKTALWSARQIEDRDSAASILVLLGDAQRRIGGENWDEAYSNYEQAKGIFSQSGDQNGVADCIRRMGSLYLFQGRPKEAEPLLNESLALSKEHQYTKGIYKGLQHITWLYDIQGKWDEAVEAAKQAREIVEAHTQDILERATSLRYLGDAYRLNREIKKAEAAYEEALQLLEKKGTAEANKHMGMVKLGLGKVYLKIPGKEKEAQAHLNESLEIQNSMGEDFRVADVLCEQSELLMLFGRFKEAEKRLEIAQEILQKLKNNFHYANALALLCELHYETGKETNDFSQVFNYAQKAREIDKENFNYHMARIEKVEGKAYLQKGSFMQAEASFERAAQKALRFNAKTFRKYKDGILGEIENLARIHPQHAFNMLQEYRRYWKKEQLTSSADHKPLIDELLGAISDLFREIEAFEPVEPI